jgi:hypothetical protein
LPAIQTINNQSHTIQGNYNLATTNWFFVTNFTGSGALRQISFSETNALMESFRVSTP